MASWRFQPPFWAVCGVIIGCGLLSALGLWQVHRGQVKQGLFDQAARSAAAPLQVLDLHSVVISEVPHVAVSGRYDAARQMLLDNQSHQSKPGYQVWTPLRLASGELILVNRGWVPQTQSREQLPQLPVSEEVQALSGFWRPLPQAGLRLDQGQCAKAEQFPVIVNYPDAARIGCLLGEPVADGQLLLDATIADGFVREWIFDNGFPPTRHYAYAAQWFALAATLFTIFLIMNLKGKQNAPHE